MNTDLFTMKTHSYTFKIQPSSASYSKRYLYILKSIYLLLDTGFKNEHYNNIYKITRKKKKKKKLM